VNSSRYNLSLRRKANSDWLRRPLRKTQPICWRQ